MSRLDDFIKKNLPRVLEEETANSLGDRSKYIGASDIGSCLRKSFLSKINKVTYDIEQQIVFQRGHIAEQIVAKMLNGSPFKEQVEVKGNAKNGFPINVHVDFTVESSKECIVIEAKSTSTPVDAPYESWILQVQLQIGLLKLLPENKNKEISGYIIAINVNTGWFDTFEIKPSEPLFNMAMNKANILADALVSNQCPDGEQQLFCSSCPFKGDCPAITKDVEDQIPNDAKQVVNMIFDLSKTKKNLDSYKAQLKDYMIATGKTRLRLDDKTIVLGEVKSKDGIDLERLKVEKPEIYNEYYKKSNGYSYLRLY